MNRKKLFLYYLNIKTLVKSFYQLYSLNSHQIYSNLFRDNNILNLYFSYDYIFHIQYINGFMELTHNHRCITINQWLALQHFTENNEIILLTDLLLPLNKNIIFYQLLYNIQFIQHNIVYDILMRSSLYFSSRNFSNL